MKTKNFVSKVFFILAAIILIISCNDNEEMISESLTAEELRNFIAIDDITAAIDDVLDQDETDDPFARNTNQSSIADCVTRTVESSNNQHTVTLDFGESCVTRNGRELSGIIQIVYTRTDNGFTRRVSFVDFFVNLYGLEGSRETEFVRSNENGNPEISSTINTTISLDNEVLLTRNGIRVREKIEGANTPTRADDVISITGNWQSITAQGVRRTREITRPLIRQAGCNYIVSGIIHFTRGEATASVDFGDGTCDNIATATGPNGNTFEIRL